MMNFLLGFLVVYIVVGLFAYSKLLKEDGDTLFDRIVLTVAWLPICARAWIQTERQSKEK